MAPTNRARSFAKTPGPLYQKIKHFIVEGIHDGTYKLNEKLPSEQDFVEQFGVSRMTVHRALRELTAEGALVRMPGVGTFVCEPKPEAASLELKDIREEIRSRGNRHDCQVIKQEVVRARQEVCHALHLTPGSTVCHALILHRENEAPVQLEERFIIEDFADGFLEENLKAHTLYEFLRARSAPTEIEHVIAATLPSARTARLLDLQESEPVLVIHRRTWVGDTVAVFTRFIYPGDRYVVDRHKMSPFHLFR